MLWLGKSSRLLLHRIRGTPILIPDLGASRHRFGASVVAVSHGRAGRRSRTRAGRHTSTSVDQRSKMGKKRGKKKQGEKNKSPKNPSRAVTAEAPQQDVPPTANVEAETGVVDAVAVDDDDDGTTSTGTLPPPGRPSLDAAAHEESFRQSLLNVISSVEDDDNDGSIADSSPGEQVQNVAQEGMLEQSNNDDDNKEDDLSANADDVTVPHSNSIEHIDGGGDGGEDDFQLPDEPIITTSFGSNSVEDELNQLQDVSTDVMVDHRGVSGVDEGVEGSASNNDEDDVVSVESESASHVTSDFTLGGYSTVSKDSAIAALASLGRDEHEGTTGGGAVDGSISPLHLTKGVSAEEGEDTNALPPLDTSVDASPEISLAGSEDGGDEEGEGPVSIDADEELDQEINNSLGAIEGELSPQKLSSLQNAGPLEPIKSIDSTDVEVGDTVTTERDGTKLGDKDGSDSDEEGKSSSVAAAATIFALGGAGAAIGAVAIAEGGEGDDLGAARKIASVPMASEVDPVDNMAKNAHVNAPPVGEEDIIVAAGVGLKGDAAAEDVASPSSENALEGGKNIQDEYPNEESSNPFDSFVSKEGSAQNEEESDKEWVSSVLAAGTASAAAAGGAVALGKNRADSGVSEDKAASPSPDDNSDEESESKGEEEEEEDIYDENADKVGPLVVAAGVVGAAAIAGAGAAVAADSAESAPSLATEGDGTMVAEGTTERLSTISPATITKNTSMGSKGSMDSGQYYSHGTFSEDEESYGDEGSNGGEDKALAATGVVGAVGIAVAAAGGLQSAPEHALEEAEEFTVISGPLKPLGGENPAERDIEEGMANESPAAGSFAAASSPQGSATDSSPKHSHNKKETSSGSKRKEKLLIAAGALVLVGGIVGIALALTLGRNDNDKSMPATSSPTPYPIDPRPPTPSALPILGTTPPTTSPIDGNFPPPQTTTSPTQAPQSNSAQTPAPQSGAPTQTPASEMPTPAPTSTSEVPTRVPTSRVPTPALESGIPTLTPQSNQPTQPRPTASPTSLKYAETVEELQVILGDVVPNPAALEDPGSPQYEAVSWLASDLVAKGGRRRMLQDTSPEETTITQRYALATLWFATGGKRWTIVAQTEDSQWLSPGPECGWKGVICSRQVITKPRGISPANSTKPQGMKSYLRSRRRIQLNSTSNETIAPTATVQTTTLEPTPSPTTAPVEASVLVVTGLELEESNVIGRIPADIVLLSALKYLTASNNAITRIPSEMGALLQLERLILNDNVIRGRIPDELAQHHQHYCHRSHHNS